MGLAGLFNVWDPDEELAVPGASSGANDVPVILQDRNFNSSNQFLYNPNMLWGYLGNRVLVNGNANAAFSLEPRALSTPLPQRFQRRGRTNWHGAITCL